jgi:single-strand DNA-binding protein
MKNINRVTLMGYLTKDPELRTFTTAGGAQRTVCHATIATNRRFTDDAGNVHEEAEFTPITIWGAAGENFAKYMRRGSPVYVEGRLSTSRWTDAAGAERFRTEVVVSDYSFLPDGNRHAEENHE